MRSLSSLVFILPVGSTLNSENSPEIRNRRLRVSSAIYGLGGEQCCTHVFKHWRRMCAKSQIRTGVNFGEDIVTIIESKSERRGAVLDNKLGEPEQFRLRLRQCSRGGKSWQGQFERSTSSESMKSTVVVHAGRRESNIC